MLIKNLKHYASAAIISPAKHILLFGPAEQNVYAARVPCCELKYCATCPVFIKFSAIFCSLSVPLTGCTDALMRFSCHPSEKLFHPHNYFQRQTSSCSRVQCGNRLVGWRAFRLGSETNVFEDRQVTNFLIQLVRFGSPEAPQWARRAALAFNALN